MPSTHTPISTPDSASRLATARALATDAACAEVVHAWRKRGIDSILLKGASTARWLYEHEPRGYVDADLLVDPRRVMDAAEVLSRLGFAPAQQHFSVHAHPWVRSPDRAVVDLHVWVWGCNRSPSRIWDELRQWVETIQIGPASVWTLGVPARSLHLALHAAQHRESPARRADLRRTLERTTFADWREAERLADRIWALPMMGVGLDLEPAGRELLGHLPLARAGLMAERHHAPLAIGLARLRQAKGTHAKARLLATAMVAERDDASAGHGLVAAQRVAWLLRGLPRSALLAWRARAYESERS